MEAVKSASGNIVDVEKKWADLQVWLEEHITFAEACTIIGMFKGDDPDKAFDLLRDHGLPTTAPESF
jgi:hypothetical protein